VNMNGRQDRVDQQTLDTGFLGGLAQSGGDDIGIGILAVPAEL